MSTKTTFSGNDVMFFFGKFKFKLYIFALCLIVVLGCSYMINQGHEYKREFNLIRHPQNVKIVKSELSNIQFKILGSSERSDTILQFYNDELKENGWAFIYEGKIPEVERNTGITGKNFRYCIYTKSNLKLTISWLDTPDRHVNYYTMEMMAK